MLPWKSSNSLPKVSTDLSPNTVMESPNFELLEKYRSVTDKARDITLTNGGIWTNNHVVATYEENTRRLSYVYPKRNVENDGISTQLVIELPLSLSLCTSNWLLNSTWSCVCSFLYILSIFFNSEINIFTEYQSQRWPFFRSKTKLCFPTLALMGQWWAVRLIVGFLLKVPRYYDYCR